jgi:ATP-binding cassette subfamily C protein
VGHILYFAKKMHAYAGKILYINLLGMGLVSLLDGMGMLLLIPILNISGIYSINTGAIPFMGVFQFFKDYPKSLSLLIILGTYVVLMTGQTLIQRNLSFRDIVLHTGFINHVRLETYRILLQANWGFLSKKRKSDLINSLTEELVRVAGGIQLFLQFLASLVFTLIQIGLAFWLSPNLTFFVLVCGIKRQS